MQLVGLVAFGTFGTDFYFVGLHCSLDTGLPEIRSKWKENKHQTRNWNNFTFVGTRQLISFFFFLCRNI